MSAAFYQDEVKFYVAVDCIILGFNNKELNVLLYKRSFEPMKGRIPVLYQLPDPAGNRVPLKNAACSFP